MTNRLGTSYKQHGIPSGAWDAIVIGSGLGGLTVASLLARHAHKRVLVLERHYTAGGFTHVFHRKGYEWDVGVHYVGDVHRPHTLLRRMFDHLTDGELAWESLGEVYDTIVIGEDRYDFVAGRDAFRARMHDYFPHERGAIDRYLAAIRTTAHHGQRFFLEKVLPPALAKVAGGALRWPARHDIRRTVRETLGSLTGDARLRGVLAGQYGDYGLPPAQASWFMHAMLVNHYLGGAAYPVGGASRIAATIMPSIEREGGAVITSAEVAEIVVVDGRARGVRLASGERIEAPLVISDAGVANTFGPLLSRDAAARAGVMPEVPGAPPSFSHVSLYVGLDADAPALGLTRANRWVYAHHDHDLAVSRYNDDPDAPLPVAYLSFPSAKDPDFARRHPGRATIEVIGVAPFAWFERWRDTPWHKRGADYEALKQRLTDRLLEVLVRECPSVASKIDHAELSSPLSTRHFANHPHGEIYGLSHTPARFAARHLRTHTPIKNLMLTGADICTAGIAGALLGGAITAAAITRKNLIGAVLRNERTTARSSTSHLYDAA